METWEWITLAIVVGAALLLVLGLAAVAIKRRRRARLQDRFGSEYDRAVSEAGRRNAEQRLGDLDREHEQLDIRPLSESARALSRRLAPC